MMITNVRRSRPTSATVPKVSRTLGRAPPMTGRPGSSRLGGVGIGAVGSNSWARAGRGVCVGVGVAVGADVGSGVGECVGVAVGGGGGTGVAVGTGVRVGSGVGVFGGGGVFVAVGVGVSVTVGVGGWVGGSRRGRPSRCRCGRGVIAPPFPLPEHWSSSLSSLPATATVISDPPMVYP